jgi:hypothetical protein
MTFHETPPSEQVAMIRPDPDHFIISLRVLFIRKSVQFNRQPSL